MPVHSAHVGQEFEIFYRWHPYFGSKVRIRQIREHGDSRHLRVEDTNGIVVMMAAWMLDPIACAGITIGPPRLDWCAPVELRQRLLDVRPNEASAKEAAGIREELNEGTEEAGAADSAHQLSLMFDTARTSDLGKAERQKVALVLARILMQAAGLTVEEYDDDDR